MRYLLLFIVFFNVYAFKSPWPAGFIVSTSSKETPFTGVTYQRLLFSAPRLMSVHVLRLDLSTPGLRFAVCALPTENKPVVKLILVRQCAAQEQAQLAVNAGFFDNSLRARLQGEGALQSLSVRNGEVLSPWSKAQQFHHGVNISPDNQVTFMKALPNDPTRLQSKPHVTYYNAVAGGVRLVTAGVAVATSQNTHPQTGIGLVQEKNKQKELLLVVIDGRQPGFSEGISYVEFAALFRSLGATEALSLDGGGSSTLIMQDKNGRLQLKNRPSDGFERLVGDSLLVFLPENSEP